MNSKNQSIAPPYLGSEKTFQIGPSRVEGVTAGDVNKMARPMGSNFEFNARGGVSNTVQASMNQFQQQVQFKDKLRRFEDLVQQQEKGAKAAYDDAIAVDPQLKEWIPVPELFKDDTTGVFMPFKYYEAFNKGLQEYKKSKKDQAAQELALKKEENQTLYQKNMLQQGQERLAIGERQAKTAEDNARTSEANALTQAQRVADQEKKTREDRDYQIKKDLRTSIAKGEGDIRNLLSKKLTAYSNDDKLEIDRELQKVRKLYDADLREYKLLNNDEDISEKAISVAIEIQNAADGLSESPKWLGADIWPKPGATDEAGQAIGGYDTVSSTSKYIKLYADKIGAKTQNGTPIDANAIEQMLVSNPPEKVIQAIMNLAQSKTNPSDSTGKSK